MRGRASLPKSPSLRRSENSGDGFGAAEARSFAGFRVPIRMADSSWV